MSFEDFDQQINDAADKHHPAYREEAWSKMEQLLDTHLPQERKRKRRIFLLLPLLLLLSVGGFFVARNFDGKVISQKSKPVSGDQGSGIGEQGTANASPVTNNQQPATDAGGGQRVAGGEEMRDGGQETGDKGIMISDKQPATSNQQPVTGNQSAIRNAQSANQPATFNRQSSASRNPPTASKNNAEKPSSRSRIKPSVNKLPKPATKDDDDNEEGISDRDLNTTPQIEEESAAVVTGEPIQPLTTGNTETPKPTPLLNNDDAPQAVTSNQQPETSNKQQPTTRKRLPATRFSNAFAVTLNGGTDMSAVRFSEPGQKRFIMGIGLQYQFLKNLTLRTSIFQTNKVYGAKPSDYKGELHTPAMGYWLSSVNGDCRVYEIPVSIAYTLHPNKKTSFFAAVGTSGMIMKKEDYVYNYKSAYGQEYDYHYGVQNKNEHLFSSIDLSAGIQQNLNNRFFFRAEPYLRLPVHGVGAGKIKLKSAGIMLTAGIKPFARK